MTQVREKLGSARQRRLEDGQLVTGAARFVDDMAMPGMLHVAFVRTPHAHARVRSIDVSAALARTGVAASFTAADLDSVKPVRADDMLPTDYQVTEWSALAADKVRFVGKAVAAVLAEDRAITEDAVGDVSVGYEPLLAVASIEQALAADAPRVHDAWPDNILIEHRM